MEVTTGWVARPPTTVGLDHLGSQQPCIELYSRLLPGITNVTDRARYYSLYPWFAWSFDRRIKSRDPEEAVALFRRADCLFTLITERYARRKEGAPGADGAAMVGRETLLPALDRLQEGRSLRLSDYATRDEGSSRYFMNRLGGLGQYYLGTLQDLGILSGEARPWIKYTHERGEVIAQAVDQCVPGHLFFKTLHDDDVTLRRLDKLSGFAFSRIPESTAEHDYLLKLFFDRDQEFGADGRQRKLSLGLLLSLARANAARKPGILTADFVKCAFYGHSLGKPRSWVIPEPMAHTAAHWRTYARNDLLSIAIQAIFFSALRILRDCDWVFHTADEIGQWIAKHPAMQKAARQIKGKTWRDAVAQARRSLPEISDWLADEHEIQIESELFSAYDGIEDEKTGFEAIAVGIKLLASIEARRTPGEIGYMANLLPAELLNYYPVNLESFRAFSNHEWQQLSVTELAGWLVSKWGITTHLRIALRKLRNNPKATFRLRPGEAGFIVEPKIPPPAPTNPRLRQGLQIMHDLGLIETRGESIESMHTELTDRGASILEDCLGE